MLTAEKKNWEWEIDNSSSYWGESLRELWSFRHLIASLVRRHFILNYQQTVLGPFWILFQPIMTLITYVVVFDKMVGIPTGTLPPVLFYFSGIVLWNFFSDSFSGTSNTFRDNAQIFSKVYFPRIIMPVSVIVTHVFRFLMQLAMLLLFIAYYWLFKDLQLSFSAWVFAVPLAVLMLGCMGLGLGLLFSVLTAKYRDISNLVSLGIRLMMFVTPVIFPLSTVPEGVQWIVKINPLSPLFELFRLSLLGEGYVSHWHLLYSFVFMVVVLSGSLLLFNKQGTKLMDVV
ncbi:ABC transporter permease [Pontibacter sp. E15-1]|uniref:ABC transporter permease n=1 Tax=Pontibacter sp. E15-1 TaxID=2919918 RepID=UPI001F4F25F5|nr:ABC transporter permease [Pontibacter sp. E15-1]MCJ8165329.1 ABC transporter permease [Pontibacter sp. E15-1]